MGYGVYSEGSARGACWLTRKDIHLYSIFREFKSYGIVEKVLKGYMPMRSVDIKARYRTTQWGSEPNYIG